MITCNLGKILKRRNINISKIAKETGISRTTITSLIKGGSNGIKFETLSTLCEYLEIPVAAIMETTTNDNGISVEKFMRLLIENSHYATSKVKIKSTKGEEFGIYAISTLENGDMEITIDAKVLVYFGS